ncbi:MAG: hypothetical protein KIS66_13885 [Fimbriimonadaceae bacterium]|nr:hypothetical protein [Fimbriimonadaceae bacterium]
MTRAEALATALEVWQALRYPKDPEQVARTWMAVLERADASAAEVERVSLRILESEEEFPAPATFLRRLGDLRREDPPVYRPGLPTMRRSEARALWRRESLREALAPPDARRRLGEAFARLEGRRPDPEG